METIWIIGAGKFGQHALKGLMKRSDATHFVVVDPQDVDASLALQKTTSHTVESIPEDGIRFLTENLKQDGANTPSWIIPALPPPPCCPLVPKRFDAGKAIFHRNPHGDRPHASESHERKEW